MKSRSGTSEKDSENVHHHSWSKVSICIKAAEPLRAESGPRLLKFRFWLSLFPANHGQII